MQRSSFDAIMRQFPNNPDETGSTPNMRFSLRNSEVYHGPWEPVPDTDDVIMVLTQAGTVFIALTAIATIGER